MLKNHSLGAEKRHRLALPLIMDENSSKPLIDMESTISSFLPSSDLVGLQKVFVLKLYTCQSTWLFTGILHYNPLVTLN